MLSTICLLWVKKFWISASGFKSVHPEVFPFTLFLGTVGVGSAFGFGSATGLALDEAGRGLQEDEAALFEDGSFNALERVSS